MTVELIITRGLPGSGKTWAARQWVADDPAHRARVNRDDYRHMLFQRYGGLTLEQEETVTVAQHAAIRALLAAGMSVIVDDTNLKLRYARAFADLAVDAGARFSVLEVDTPAGQCIERDALRRAAGERGVGWKVIADLAERFANRDPVVPTGAKEAWAPEPYVADPTLPPAWIFDIDGTMARKLDGPDARGWHDYHRVGEDEPVREIIDIAKALRERPVDGLRPAILVMSGRNSSCEDETRDWLWEHLDWCDLLVMRAEDDRRDDAIVKAELFDAHVRGKYNVRGVVDDRPGVCRMWRAMGLRVLQVGDPHIEF